MNTEYLALTESPAGLPEVITALNGGGYAVVNYEPTPPDLSLEDIQTAFRDSNYLLIARRHVTEAATIRITATTHDALRGLVNSLEAILRRAEDPVYTVYVRYRPHGLSSQVYRSEVLTGQVIIEAGEMDWGRWEKKTILLKVTWTRRYFWEDVTLTEIPLTNAINAKNADGLQVHNADDATRDNYALASADVLKGTIPAPIRLEMVHGGTDAGAINTLWVGVNSFQSPQTFSGVLQGEAAVAGVVPTSVQPGAANAALYSGGQARVFGPLLGDYPNSGMYWTLATAFLNQSRGAYFMALARFTAQGTNPNGGQFGLRMAIGGLELWQGPMNRVRNNNMLQELGAVQLPPGAVYDAYHPIELHFLAQRLGSFSYALDDLILLPLTSYRKIEAIVYAINATNRIVLDEIEGKLYSDRHGNAGSVTNYIVSGTQLSLWPGINQRLVFAWMGSDGTAPPGASLRVRAFTRERRLTI